MAKNGWVGLVHDVSRKVATPKVEGKDRQALANSLMQTLCCRSDKFVEKTLDVGVVTARESADGGFVGYIWLALGIFGGIGNVAEKSFRK